MAGGDTCQGKGPAPFILVLMQIEMLRYGVSDSSRFREHDRLPSLILHATQIGILPPGCM